MSNRGEIWVHGNSAVIQYPGGAYLEFTDGKRMQKVSDPENTSSTVAWSDITGLRRGGVAVFRGQANNHNWFHFSIPTPAVVPETDPTKVNAPHVGITIDRVSLYYFTPGEDIAIDSIQLSDSVGVAIDVPLIWGNATLYGHCLDSFIETRNSFLLAEPIVLRPDLPGPHGVLISVRVNFRVEGDIQFGCAGIHYHVG